VEGYILHIIPPTLPAPPASPTSGYFWHLTLWISQFCIMHFPLSVRPLHTHTHQGVDIISEIKIHRTWLTKHNVVSSATVQPTGESELMYQINLTAPPLCFWRRRSVIDIFWNGSRLLATNLRLLPDAGPWLQIAASRHHTGSDQPSHQLIAYLRRLLTVLRTSPADSSGRYSESRKNRCSNHDQFK